MNHAGSTIWIFRLFAVVAIIHVKHSKWKLFDQITKNQQQHQQKKR